MGSEMCIRDRLGTNATMEELQQLHLRDSFEPMIPKEMTRHEKHEALKNLMFLKKKRCGRIKGRTCADGRPQRKYIPKEDAASPTVSLEGVLLTAVVDDEEGRDIAVVDIPNAFVQTKNVDKVIMKMRGKLAELMVLMAPEIYRKAIILEHGKPVLYVRLLGALSGQLKAALLWYKKLVSDLEEKGFVTNPVSYTHLTLPTICSV